MTLMQLYKTFPLEVTKAKGCYLYGSDGRRYVDTFSGLGVHILGHGDRGLLSAMTKKMQRFVHLSNFFHDDDARQVARKLLEFAGADGRVYFGNSGAEAMEAALKCVKRQATSDRKKIVCFEQSFHGRTLGALSLNGFADLRTPFEPLLPDVVRLPFNDEAAFKSYFESDGNNVVAVAVETVLGSGGVVPITPEFAKAIADAHAALGFVLICDEVQTGLGRTGKIFAYQHFALRPDIVAVGKALGGGLPLSATLFLGNQADVFTPGDHGTTFAPNPVALAGSAYVLTKVEELTKRVNDREQYFRRSLLRFSEHIREVRGLGLMLGVELNDRRPRLRDEAFYAGLLLNVISDQVIRFLPSIVITYAEIDEIIDKLSLVLV